MKNFVLFLFIHFFTYSLWSQVSEHQRVMGEWLSENKKQRIRVSYNEQSKSYYGKIIWMYEDDQANGRVLLDVNNPNVKLRNRRVTGITLMHNFKAEGGGKYRGKIYDPISGKFYSCVLTLLPNNQASIRGYILHPWIGRTEIATKVSD